MSLYDGLDISDSNASGKEAGADVSGWGSSLKLLKGQKELQAKKQQSSLLGTKKRSAPTVAPVMDLRGKKVNSVDTPVYFNQITGKMEKEKPLTPASKPRSAAAGGLGAFIGSEVVSSGFPGVTEEYDPLRPNDYEDYAKQLKERRAREREADRQRELEERERRRRERRDGHDSEGEPDRKQADSSDEDEDEARKYDRPRAGGAAIAPPPSLIEESPPGPEDDGPTGIGPGGFGFVGGSVAAKIMSKMGYKEGQGLGKKEQGMSTALQVEKTGKRAGKIIHEKDIPKVPEPRPEVPNTNLLKNPSKVVLLRNMVGPGEVDDELEQETMDECQKYGKCLKCVIFEIPGQTEDEAVRIFVEFEKVDAAIKAIIDLNGRFFGGRSVKACFYNLDKYRRLDLADSME